MPGMARYKRNFCKRMCFFKKKRANPGLFIIYFRPFKHTLQFLLQIHVKMFMSIQYTVPGFELTTFATGVSSHNH